jgi:CheY-like chemotaxis protein
MHVLVVDDEPAVCASICRMLNLLGHTSSSAINGDDALSLMRAEQPAIVMLDLRLGPRSIAGSDVWARKLLDPDIRATPVVVVTGLLASAEESDDRYEAVRNALAGTTLVLGKPLTMSTLKTVLSLLDEEHSCENVAAGAHH